MDPTRPNTIEEWYPDALRFVRSKYRYLPDLVKDDLCSRFAVRVAQRVKDFDPTRGRALTFLCMLARQTYWTQCRSRFGKNGTGDRCLMTRGVNVAGETETPEQLEAILALKGVWYK